jgi:hypothetical protein
MKLNYPVIKDWALIGDETKVNPYRAPELNPVRLHGKIFGSENFKDGSQITTSAIQRMIEEQGVIIVETMHSKYIIRKEEMSGKYEAKWGNVWEKLLTNINSLSE